MLKKLLFISLLFVLSVGAVAAQDDEADIRVLLTESVGPVLFELAPDASQMVIFEDPIVWQRTEMQDPARLRLQLVHLDDLSIIDLRGHIDMVAAAAYAPDGATLLTWHRNGEFIQWDTATGDLLSRVNTGLLSNRTVITYLPNGEQIAGFNSVNLPSALVYNLAESTFRIYAPTATTFEDVINDVDVFPETPVHVSVAAGGGALLVTSNKGNIWRYDLATGDDQQLYTAPDQDIPLFPLAGTIVTGGANVFDQQILVFRREVLRQDVIPSVDRLEDGRLETLVPDILVATYDAPNNYLMWVDFQERRAPQPLTVNVADLTTRAVIDSITLDPQALPDAAFTLLDVTVDDPRVVLPGAGERNLLLGRTGPLGDMQASNSRLVIGGLANDDNTIAGLVIIDLP